MVLWPSLWVSISKGYLIDSSAVVCTHTLSLRCPQWSFWKSTLTFQPSLINTEWVWRSFHFLGPSLIWLSVLLVFPIRVCKIGRLRRHLCDFFRHVFHFWAKSQNQVKCLDKYNETTLVKNPNRTVDPTPYFDWAYVCMFVFFCCFSFMDLGFGNRYGRGYQHMLNVL